MKTYWLSRTTVLAFLALVTGLAFGGGVITYRKGPGIIAGVWLNETIADPGTTVLGWTTDGTDPYNFASDTDWKYVDGNYDSDIDDFIKKVVYSVTLGTVSAPNGGPGTETYTSEDVLEKFPVEWHIPANAAPGVYTITAKVYDEGYYGAASLDSVDPNPLIRTKTIAIGPETVTSAPEIEAFPSASPSAPAVGQEVTLTATDGANPAGIARDRDSRFLAGVFTEYLDDTIHEFTWRVTDGNGKDIGTLSADTGATVTWTAPSAACAAYVMLTSDDNGTTALEGKDRRRTTVLPVSVGGAAIPTPQPPAAIAITAARAFCAALGYTETTPATTLYPAPAPYVGAEPTHYQPRYLVTFDDGVEVEVITPSAHIASYANLPLMEAPSGDDPPGTAITEAAAIVAANAALTAAGVTTDLGDPTASEDQITEPPTRAGHSWTVVRPRTFTQAPYAAVPYRDQQATVIMQAETGEVHAMGVTFDSLPPTSAAGSVTSTQAAATALAVLTAAGIMGMTADTPVKTAVRPNTWWQTNGTMDPLPGPAKVAWLCRYSNDVEMHEVWVDIATGDVIGGESATVRGRRQAKTIRGLGGLVEVWTGSWSKEGSK